ncbi:hypothetical protein [Pseudolysinimonas sp.]|uniref:hypothetical protein n=1 Tax=Pseudolysinimonas sp. TaxID=2680009 RepID=UPI003F7FFD3C
MKNSNPRFAIREFKTGSVVEFAADYEAGFQRCMHLYLRSDRRKSYYVKEMDA